MEGYIGQVILFPKSYSEVKDWMPCDGRELKWKDYTPLAAIIGGPLPEGMHYYDELTDDMVFNLPLIESPHPEYVYIICVNGMFPTRT